jgi:alanine racemase
VRPSWLEIDLSAIRRNVAAFRRLASPAAVCAVVKADGYGHGDVPVADAALAAGAGVVAVALVEEGVRLREAGIEAPILLLSEPPVEDASEVLHWRLTPTVYRHSFLEALLTAADGEPVDVHVKLDTGMHRVGASTEVADQLARRMAVGGSRARLAAVWTHFAVAEEDEEFTRHQIGAFDDFVGGLRRGGIAVPVTHLANTAGTILHADARSDMVRVGLGLYGLHPSPACAGVIDLVPAMRLVSQVAYVQRRPTGARPSYGRRRPLGADSNVATVPIGYADGVPRLLSDGGEVLVGGRRRPLAGTVTMDQIVVDVGDDPIRVGDEVVLLGRQGSEEIGADEWAERTRTISYEIVCGMGPRLPRRYVG